MDPASFLIHCLPRVTANHSVRRCSCAHSIFLLCLLLSWNPFAFSEEIEASHQKLIFEYSCEQSVSTDYLIKLSDSRSGDQAFIAEYYSDSLRAEDANRLSLSDNGNQLTLTGITAGSKGRFSTVLGSITPTLQISVHRRDGRGQGLVPQERADLSLAWSYQWSDHDELHDSQQLPQRQC